MGWRKRPPGEGGGYLEDIALRCTFWPLLALGFFSLLVLFRHTAVPASAIRSWRVAGGTFPTQGGDDGGGDPGWGRSLLRAADSKEAGWISA
jgi:hypothetical protein